MARVKEVLTEKERENAKELSKAGSEGINKWISLGKTRNRLFDIMRQFFPIEREIIDLQSESSRLMFRLKEMAWDIPSSEPINQNVLNQLTGLIQQVKALLTSGRLEKIIKKQQNLWAEYLQERIHNPILAEIKY